MRVRRVGDFTDTSLSGLVYPAPKSSTSNATRTCSGFVPGTSASERLRMPPRPPREAKRLDADTGVMVPLVRVRPFC